MGYLQALISGSKTIQNKTMKTKLLIILITLLHTIPYLLSAQDVILRKNGDEISAKITEITLEEVKYKKFSNPSGPVYTEPLSELFMIKYENGDKDLFEKNGTTGKIEVKHVASIKSAQPPANTVVETNKETTSQQTTSSTTPKATSKAENTKGQSQTKVTSKKDNETPQNNQLVKGKSVPLNDSIATLRFKNNTAPVRIGEIGNGEDGKTFVQILGKFDINTGTAYKTFIEMFLAVMKIKIIIGDKTFEAQKFNGINEGIEFNFVAGGVNSLKFNGIQFTFDISELPDSIVIYNDEFSVTFDGKTKTVRK